MKVHLVDGTFELFRCFHGAPRATNRDGREVGAARGMLATFVSLLRQPDVTHVAVAFDAMAGRERLPANAGAGELLQSQYPLAADLLRALGLTLWPMYRFQADDALASGAERYKSVAEVEQVVICTTDLDLVQCVAGERVILLDRIRKRTTSEVDVVTRFGVPPPSYPDFVALVGIPSKGIQGVPGWGPRSAAALVARYGSLEQIPDDPQGWEVAVRGAARLGESLGRRRREAVLIRNLYRLRLDVPLTDGVGDLEWRGAERQELSRLAERIGAPEILERVPSWRGE